MIASMFSNSTTAQGYNHIKNNKICEDNSGHYDSETVKICIVADGHGSDDYPRTDRGSKFAVESAIQCIKQFVEDASPDEVITDKEKNYPMLTQLAKSILNQWHKRIHDDYGKNPFCENELSKVKEKYRVKYLSDNEDIRKIEKAYGTTLIAFVISQEYSFGMQIGDGKCVIVNQNGEFLEPIPIDDNCQLNVTTSLCDGDAIDEFRYYVTDSALTAVFCGTDGIEDSYSSPEELYALYRSILNIYLEHGIAVGNSEVKSYLPILSQRGSGDDVSIASIIDFDALGTIRSILSVQDEIFALQRKLMETKERYYSFESRVTLLKNNIEKAIKNGGIIGNQAGQYDALVKDKVTFSERISSIETKIQELILLKQDLIFEKEMASFDKQENAMADDYYLDDNEHEGSDKTMGVSIENGDRLVLFEQKISFADGSVVMTDSEDCSHTTVYDDSCEDDE